jgi:deoxyhypusine synthase
MGVEGESGPIQKFLRQHFRHFNASTLVDAGEAYRQLIKSGGKMMLALAGAMSTAEIGLSLAHMIRSKKVHAISCTGANLEEDLFNLLAHDSYVKVPHYRELRAADEMRLLEKGLNRVTDTCIPEREAIRRIQKDIVPRWKRDAARGERKFPHEYFYELVLDAQLAKHFQIDPKESWLLAAAQQRLPLFVPGWEDSSMGNIFAAEVLHGRIERQDTIRSGLEYMGELVRWYRAEAGTAGIGFFQIGGGIAGDFAISVVPLIRQELAEDVPVWRYFCQISDSTTSYGSYSGAVPNEKITWGKLQADTPRFIIESDATIVAPLLFAYVLGW